jgi:hypothetical protein
MEGLRRIEGSILSRRRRILAARAAVPEPKLSFYRLSHAITPNDLPAPA